MLCPLFDTMGCFFSRHKADVHSGLGTGSHNDPVTEPNAPNPDTSMLGLDQDMGRAGGMFLNFNNFNEDDHTGYLNFDSRPQEFAARGNETADSFMIDASALRSLEYTSMKARETSWHRQRQQQQQHCMDLSQRIEAIDRVLNFYIKLSEPRQKIVSAQRAAAIQSSKMNKRAVDEIITSVFSEVLDFCETILTIFDEIPISGGTKHVAELYSMTAIAIMTINAIVDIHDVILSDCEGNAESSANPLIAGRSTASPSQYTMQGTRRTTITPPPSSHEQIPTTSNTQGAMADRATLLGSGNMASRHQSGPSSSESSLRNPSPLSEPAPANPVLTLLIRLDTMEFNVAHLQAICASLLEIAERLQSSIVGGGGGGDDNDAVAAATVGPSIVDHSQREFGEGLLLREIGHTKERISSFQQDVVKLSKNLKKPVVALEEQQENTPDGVSASQSFRYLFHASDP